MPKCSLIIFGSSNIFAPRCGAICYVIYFLSLFTSYRGIPQKSSKNLIFVILSKRLKLIDI